MAAWEWILGIFGILLLLGVLAGLGYLIYYESKKHNGHNTVICANNPVTPPTNVNATTSDGKNINVTWQSVSGVDGYNVYLSQSSNFTPGPDNFNKSVSGATSKMATIGPFNVGTYYLSVASYTGNCRSTAVPSMALMIKLNNIPPPMTKVRFHLYNNAYNLSCGSDSHGATGYYMRNDDSYSCGSGSRIDLLSERAQQTRMLNF